MFSTPGTLCTVTSPLVISLLQPPTFFLPNPNQLASSNTKAAMGVKGLLPCLQSITRSVSLENYRGLTVAVDAMSWLHKGVFACDVKALAKSQRSSAARCGSAEMKCVQYAINKAQMLQSKFGMEILFVIDGDALPSKKEENSQRRAERDSAFEKAMTAEASGDSRAARRYYAQSCSVTHKIRYELMKACKLVGIAFIVAPYEADAQMARLAHTGVVDLVITEDSDILVYGCPRACFKIDFDTCQGQEIQLMKNLGENESLSFKNWTHDMFVFMCIISGCDYCKGLPGIGIKLAHKIVRVHRTPSKIFSALRGAGRMPTDFEEKFWIAFRTFRHQRVFCPSRQQIETLFPIAGSNHEASPNQVWPFLGEYIEPNIAIRIADGTLHPSKKTEWNIALKEETQRLSNADLHIHHRSSNVNDRTKKPKENVWHSLVYGSGNGKHCSDREHSERDSSGQQQQQHHHHNPSSTHVAKDLFRFFPQPAERASGNAEVANGNAVESKDDSHPPLKEIYVDESANDAAQPKYAMPPNHKDIPLHFHEYTSRLVGNTFKPISRKRRKRDDDGTKSSKCVQQIWEKSSEAQPRATAVPEQRTKIKESRDRSQVNVEEGGGGGGIKIFARESNPLAKAQECIASWPTTLSRKYEQYDDSRHSRHASNNIFAHDLYEEDKHCNQPRDHRQLTQDVQRHHHRSSHRSAKCASTHQYHRNATSSYAAEHQVNHHRSAYGHQNNAYALEEHSSYPNHHSARNGPSNSSRYNDSRSVSGATTLEGSQYEERTIVDSAHHGQYQDLTTFDDAPYLLYPYFPEFHSCDARYDDGCDDGCGLFRPKQSAPSSCYYAHPMEQDDACADGNMDAFQLFQSDVDDYKQRDTFGFDDMDEHSIVERSHYPDDGLNGGGRRSEYNDGGNVFDDGLLMAFDEMQQW